MLSTLGEFDDKDKDVAEVVGLLHGVGYRADEVREARNPAVIAILLSQDPSDEKRCCMPWTERWPRT